MARAGKSSAQGALGIDKGAQALDRKVPGISMGQVVGGDTSQPSGEKGGDTMGTEGRVLGMEHVGDMGGRRASNAFDRIKGLPPLAMRNTSTYKPWAMWVEHVSGVEEAVSIDGKDCASMDKGMSGTSNGYMAKDVPGEEANASVG
jgi:hypothetical protein